MEYGRDDRKNPRQNSQSSKEKKVITYSDADASPLLGSSTSQRTLMIPQKIISQETQERVSDDDDHSQVHLHLPGEGNVRYVCDLCGKKYSSGRALGGHKRHHRWEENSLKNLKLKDENDDEDNEVDLVSGLSGWSKIGKRHKAEACEYDPRDIEVAQILLDMSRGLIGKGIAIEEAPIPPQTTVEYQSKNNNLMINENPSGDDEKMETAKGKGKKKAVAIEEDDQDSEKMIKKCVKNPRTGNLKDGSNSKFTDDQCFPTFEALREGHKSVPRRRRGSNKSTEKAGDDETSLAASEESRNFFAVEETKKEESRKENESAPPPIVQREAAKETAASDNDTTTTATTTTTTTFNNSDITSEAGFTGESRLVIDLNEPYIESQNDSL